MFSDIVTAHVAVKACKDVKKFYLFQPSFTAEVYVNDDSAQSQFTTWSTSFLLFLSDWA